MDTETKANCSYYFRDNGLPDNRIQAIAKDPSGNVWFGMPNGVSRWNRESFTNFTPVDGLADYNVLDIAKDADGSIWAATEKGVSRWSETNEVETNPGLTRGFQFIQNFKNPFNSSTSFSFDLQSDAKVKLEIWSSIGQRIATLVDGPLSKGKYFSVRSGTDGFRAVESGIYLSVMTVSDRGKVIRDVKKPTLIK